MITDTSQAKQKGTTNIFETSFHVGFGSFLHEVFGFGWLVAVCGGGGGFFTVIALPSYCPFSPVALVNISLEPFITEGKSW